MTKLLSGVAVCLVIASASTLAQVPSKRIAGYKCMMLNITEQQSMSPVFHVSLRDAPSRSAQEAGWAASVVIVKEPAIATAGFLEVLKPNGERAWIAADMVKPYRPVADPAAKCVPVVLPNGRIGTGPG